MNMNIDRIVQNSILEAGISLYLWLFYSSFFIGFYMFWPSVSSGAVGATKVVFSFILLPVLVQSTFECLHVWCLNNSKTKEIAMYVLLCSFVCTTLINDLEQVDLCCCHVALA